MEKVYTVTYADAYYSYEPDLRTKEYYSDKGDLREGTTSLHVLTAHGYVEKFKNNFIVAFVKKKGTPLQEIIESGEDIIDGIIIPDTALISHVKSSQREVLKGISVGSRVAVMWRDVVRV